MSNNKEALLVRREYNRWVANETMEDYALRYTAKQARRWSSSRVATTALGIVSFLALEAIGGAITLSYGFTNAIWAIVVVSLIIFLCGLPTSFYAARYGVDIDLLTRGAGFGYLGSTISSLIYASFTFIFFALEAAIMSMAIHMATGVAMSLAYVISALAVIPLVTHGISRISRFQVWTQPLWVVLQLVPLVFIALHESAAFAQWLEFPGLATGESRGFDLLYFGAAAAVIFPLIAQNGEQADFLRFLPVATDNKRKWWAAVISAGPGWVVFGALKLCLGSFLAVLALEHGLQVSEADDPTHMYAVAFNYITHNPQLAIWLAAFFVVISQLKINVTNAYAGSIAWSNFFSRLTHNHPGRVVWLLFNVAIALMLMELGLYQAFEKILVIYATLVVAWIGSLVADLVINKPLGLSPAHIEHRRGHLYDINPVGVSSMFIASCVGIAANLGVFGPLAQAMAAFLALGIPFITVPLIAWLTAGRYYLSRENDTPRVEPGQISCSVCGIAFDSEDTSVCPSYHADICSLCCSLETRCADRCRPQAHFSAQSNALFSRLLPAALNEKLHSVTGHFFGIFTVTSLIIASLLAVVFYAQQNMSGEEQAIVGDLLWQVFFLLLLVTGVLVWLYVLAQRSARMALQETQTQADLLQREVLAHKSTAQALIDAKNIADAANQAKSRYLSGVSHELRTPLNTIYGYAQLMDGNTGLDEKSRKIATVIRRSCEHLSDVIEGLLEISRIEARKLEIHNAKVAIEELVRQLEDTFSPLAAAKNIAFSIRYLQALPAYVQSDETRLRQILLNLLSNAFKFTQQGSVELRISYRNQVAQFSVHDTGVGITQADQKRIFEPFERVRDGLNANVKGTGLGLSISHLLAELMGGTISLESTPGVGSEFILHLFLPALSGIYEKRGSAVSVLAYDGEQKRILVVDDEENHRQLLHDWLSPLGFVVDQADAAAQALRLAQATPPDLFILDVSMAQMSGWELLSALREQNHRQPVIMLSANPKEQTSSSSPQQFDAYLSKPVRREKLLEHLQRSLSLRWQTVNDEDSTARTQALDTLNQDDNAQLQQLAEHAAIGYLSGIVQCLGLLEQTHADADWFQRMKLLTELCDMEGIMRIVDQLRAGTT